MNHLHPSIVIRVKKGLVFSLFILLCTISSPANNRTDAVFPPGVESIKNHHKGFFKQLFSEKPKSTDPEKKNLAIWALSLSVLPILMLIIAFSISLSGGAVVALIILGLLAAIASIILSKRLIKSGEKKSKWRKLGILGLSLGILSTVLYAFLTLGVVLFISLLITTLEAIFEGF